MKKLISYIIIITCLYSCNELFYEEDNKYTVLDKIEDKVDLINGMYTLILNAHDNSYINILCRSDDVNLYYRRNFTAGGIFPNNISGCSTGNYNFDVTIEESLITIYNNLYKAIANANSISASPRIKNDEPLLGETYFLRAYCYLKLARIFGQPPLIEDIDVNFFVEKPTYTELYEFIESDLLSAIDLLPDFNYERVPHETPNKTTAKALLAEVYLNMGGYPVNNNSKYSKAAEYAGQVIKENAYNLVADLADLWKSSNKYNSENIFSLFFDTSIKPDNNGSYGESKVNYYNPSMMSISYFGGSDEIYTNVMPAFSPEIKYYINYPDNYRKWVSFTTGKYSANNFTTTEGQISGYIFNEINPLLSPCSFVEGVASQKWTSFSEINAAKEASFLHYAGSTTPLYLLRYAHTLLTYAEAKAHAGELDASAIEALNQVRRRANKLSPYESSLFDISSNISTEQFIDSVVWERAWELNIEPDGRWFDIVRLDLKNKLQTEYRYDQDLPSVVSPDLLTEGWYFYKIPETDRLINPFLN